ncbi:HNH endonuclease signature motif containing protein [Streptomyces sp. NPDC127172]|uniref:HNH endonuclease signature motif containing protein n=1 Tax=Streptomyces sp. NPDC127172 TaxID=3345382 RepID=UPI00363A95FC
MRAARQRGKSASQKGYDSRWERTRRAFLKEHPYCECSECLEIPEPLRPAAQVVDHIDGLGPLGPRGHDWTNLRAMTKQHHDQHTARTQPGGWNDRES